MWNPHQPISGGQRKVLGALAILAAVGLWAALSLSGAVKPKGASDTSEYYLPTPISVGCGLAGLLIEDIEIQDKEKPYEVVFLTPKRWVAGEDSNAPDEGLFRKCRWEQGRKDVRGILASTVPSDIPKPPKISIEPGNLLSAAWASIRRVVLALGLVLVLGLPMGVLMGSSSKVNAFFSPLVDPLRSAPVVAVLPIIVLWFGIDETAKVMFLWLGAIVFFVPMVRDAIVAVPRQHLILAEDLGGTPLETIRHSVIPLAMPRIVDAVIVAVGIEWTYITVAEYVNAASGLGYIISTAKKVGATDRMFAGIMAILIIALIADQSLKFLKRRLYPWETE